MIGRTIDIHGDAFVVVGVTDDDEWALRPVEFGENIALGVGQLRALGVDAVDPRRLAGEVWEA